MEIFLPLLILLCSTIFSASAASGDSIITAVFEHARRDNFSEYSTEKVINTNMDYYRKAAAAAKSKGAQLIVFPEYGLFPPTNERTELKPFLEYVPNPQKIRTNPCDEKESYLKRPILRNLSCIAKSNSLIIVANIGDIQTCTGDPNCPEDGVYHLNTNVVFDKDGNLIFRYHKEYLFFELSMDLPKERHNPVFKTDIGTFATFICFDIMFERASEMARQPDIDAILFSTFWMNSFAMRTAIDYWQAFAVGNNATLLASNLQIPGYFASGSGIFNGQHGSLAHTFNPDGISKLVVSEIPRKSSHNKKWKPSESSVTLITENGPIDWRSDGKDIPKECDYKKLGIANDIYKDYRCLHESLKNYTLTELTQPNGQVQICNQGMCCSLNYSTNGLKENFYLGVFNGTHNSFDRYFWVEENCFIARCDTLEGGLHCNSSSKSNTRFLSLNLSTNFTTDFVYPSVMTNNYQLLPERDWQFKKRFNKRYIKFENKHGIELLAASLKGRCFDRDPSYKR